MNTDVVGSVHVYTLHALSDGRINNFNALVHHRLKHPSLGMLPGTLDVRLSEIASGAISE